MNPSTSMPESSFDIARDWLELLSFASTPVLVVLAALALRGITISRKVANAKSRRDAATLAAQLCDKFGDTILPAMSVLRRKMEPHLVIPVKIKPVEFTIEEINEQDPLFIPSCHKAIRADPSVTEDIMKVANMLEGLAIYFAQGIADESIAFPPLGKTYLEYLPLVAEQIALNRRHNSKLYTNCIELYRLWHDRQTHEALSASHEILGQQLAGVKNRKISTLGTDV